MKEFREPALRHLTKKMNKDLSFLLQMAKSLDELETKLESYYKIGDAENFNKTKKTMLDVQKKISEAANAI